MLREREHALNDMFKKPFKNMGRRIAGGFAKMPPPFLLPTMPPLTPYSPLLLKRGWGDLYKDRGMQGGIVFTLSTHK